jgi:hypothetical protein
MTKGAWQDAYRNGVANAAQTWTSQAKPDASNEAIMTLGRFVFKK